MARKNQANFFILGQRDIQKFMAMVKEKHPEWDVWDEDDCLVTIETYDTIDKAELRGWLEANRIPYSG